MSIANVNKWKSFGDFGRWLRQRSWVQWFIHWPNLHDYWNFDDDPPNSTKKRR